MNSVKFGAKDSYKDWNLILNPKSRPLASPKTNYVSIEGKDGDLDLTTSLTGDVKYNNVSCSLEFTMLDKRENWESKLQEISTYLHGKKMDVIFSEDPEWYCVGRMTLDELECDKGLGVIAIDCEFEPYKLKVNETIITETIEANKVITLPNSRKWVMPTIETFSKNLLNPIGASTSTSTISFTNNGDGTFTLKGTPDNNFSCNLTNLESHPIKLKKGVTYTQTVIVLSGSFPYGCSVCPSIKDDLGNITYNYFTNNSSKKTEKDCEINYYSAYVSSGKTIDCTFKVQLEEGPATEYTPYVDAYANFIFEDTTYSVNGTLKTPDILLKEGGSEITLTSGQGNIKISYREGKL